MLFLHCSNPTRKIKCKLHQPPGQQMKATHDHKTSELFSEHQRDIPCAKCEQLFNAQRTASHRLIARWQREFFAMKSERDGALHLLQITKRHSEAFALDSYDDTIRDAARAAAQTETEWRRKGSRPIQPAPPIPAKPPTRPLQSAANLARVEGHSNA